MKTSRGSGNQQKGQPSQYQKTCLQILHISGLITNLMVVMIARKGNRIMGSQVDIMGRKDISKGSIKRRVGHHRITNG